MLLPIFQSKIQEFILMQNKWSSILNALIANRSVQSTILQDLVLINGTNVIDHLLGRKLIGWRIIRINGVASIYDGQSSNQIPNLTLVLISSAAVTVSIEVF